MPRTDLHDDYKDKTHLFLKTLPCRKYSAICENVIVHDQIHAVVGKGEEIAKETNSLEVLEGNAIARTAYHQFGFTGYELDLKMGKALFYEKKL